MKKITFLFLAFITLNSFAQLNVVETEPAEEIGKLKALFDTTMESTKRGDIYTILYQDVTFKQIKEFKSFSMNEQTFNELYDLIISKWDNPPKEDIMIELTNSFLWLKFTRMMGITNLQFVHAPIKTADVFGLSVPMTQKQVNKIFGK